MVEAKDINQFAWQMEDEGEWPPSRRNARMGELQAIKEAHRCHISPDGERGERDIETISPEDAQANGKREYFAIRFRWCDAFINRW